MALEQLDTSFNKHDTPLGKWKEMNDEVEENISGGFECNICLDLVHDPVVTLCGHLYCWPCIYKWIHFQSVPSENSDQQQPQCPVCKAEVSEKTLIPLYGRGGQSTKPSEGKAPNLGIVIPQRPPSPRCGGHMLISTTDSNPSQLLQRRSRLQQSQTRQSPYQQSVSPVLSPGGTTANMLQPSMIGEVAYARIFGTGATVGQPLATPATRSQQQQRTMAGRSSTTRGQTRRRPVVAGRSSSTATKAERDQQLVRPDAAATRQPIRQPAAVRKPDPRADHNPSPQPRASEQ